MAEVAAMAEGTGGEIVAEFVQTMKDWHRMCNKYFDGENWVCNKTCRMYGFEVCSKPTAKYPVPLEIGQDLAHEIDCVITAWVKDNREPVYPSWGTWLYEKYDFDLREIMYTPIPADIAEKLGIEPKEE